MKLLLELPRVYQWFSRAVGARRSREIYVRDFVRPRPGDLVLDIGCGPADILDHLPQVEYWGFDVNPAYIEHARRRYGDRGQFHCERVSEARAFAERSGRFDIALATGVLHHLDDAEARELFRIARQGLRPGGRLVTFDGCFVDGQSRAARYLLERDRGRYVRRPEEYARLAGESFAQVATTVRNDLLRIPYTHVMLECSR